jgi:uncharacterized protein YPO0396
METQQLLTEIRQVVKEELKTGLDEVRSDFRHELKTGLDEVRSEMRTGFDEVHEMIHDLSSDIDTRFSDVNARLNGIESQMVTKDYLDERLGAFRCEVVEVTKNAALRAVGAL